MFVAFFHELKAAGVPVTLREYLTLLEANGCRFGQPAGGGLLLPGARRPGEGRAQSRQVRPRVRPRVQGPRADERGAHRRDPAEWLKKLAEKYLTEEEKKQIEAMGGLDKLLETLRQAHAEQKGRHQGGSKWIGTAGTSPFGAYGYNPEGVRIGQDEDRNFRAVKVWDRREFKDLDDRSSSAPATSRSRCGAAQVRPHRRARGARPRRHHQGHRAQGLSRHPDAAGAAQCGEGAAVLRLGGSMDWHIKATEELFSAARTEFKHMEHFYFHNCLYERCGRRTAALGDTRRPGTCCTPIRTTTRSIFVGDASMSPYEIMAPGGSVEHFQRGGRADVDGALSTRTYPACVWLNPVPEHQWDYTASIRMVRQLHRQPHVPAHPGRARPRDARAGAIALPLRVITD
jgi:uncharacterized protein with von Willebrand factor type A (vWA) domain